MRKINAKHNTIDSPILFKMAVLQQPLKPKVELGAAIKVALTIVPCLMVIPKAAR